MRLKLVEILERGVPNKERLHLSVITPARLNYYAVFDTVKAGIGIVAIPRHAYWFTEKAVNLGDHVVLYTGPGGDTTEARPDGFKNHFFHWGLPQTIWAEPNSCAVLIEINMWESSL